MKNKLPIILALVAALAAAAAGIYTARQQAATAPSAAPATATQAQHAALNTLLGLELADTSGTRQPLAQWKGKILVLNFWATWCPPCRKEMPDLATLQQKFAGKGVQVVGVSIDTAENVKTFQQQYKIPFPLLIAEPEVAQWTTELGNTAAGLPFTLVLDKNGQIRHAKLGQISAPELENLLTDLTRS